MKAIIASTLLLFALTIVDAKAAPCPPSYQPSSGELARHIGVGALKVCKVSQGVQAPKNVSMWARIPIYRGDKIIDRRDVRYSRSSSYECTLTHDPVHVYGEPCGPDQCTVFFPGPVRGGHPTAIKLKVPRYMLYC